MMDAKVEAGISFTILRMRMQMCVKFNDDR